jgi:hypothetical protein
MKNPTSRRSACGLLLVAVLSTLAAAGCGGSGACTPPPLGTLSDPIWTAQEENAEPSKFVLYQHEFVYNQPRLNSAGEDHLKQIAARIHAGQNVPVLVERSTTSARPGTEFQYPVHVSPELDMSRRDVVVQILTTLQVADAEQRVIVSPALARGLQGQEAARAYDRGSNVRNARRDFSDGFGGFGS